MGHYTIDAAAVAALPGHPPIDHRVHGCADSIYRDSQALVPVETGHLKESGFAEGSRSEYRVGYTVSYAHYVEYGTSEMNAEPFLSPAAIRNRGRL